MSEWEFADHAFLDGRLTLREPRRGHRSGTDAILLSAAAHVSAGQHVLDVGAGAGAVALAILSQVDDATATLIEREPNVAALARHNIEVNGFSDRAKVVEIDIFDRAVRHTLHVTRGDVVVSNPPFYLPGTVRASDNRQRVGSHILSRSDHGDWLRELLTLVTPRGRIVLIHRPDAVPSLMFAVEGRAAIRLRSIHPKDGLPAHRVLLELSPGKRTPFVIQPPLTLHDDEGRFTQLAEDLHRGRCSL